MHFSTKISILLDINVFSPTWGNAGLLWQDCRRLLKVLADPKFCPSITSKTFLDIDLRRLPYYVPEDIRSQVITFNRIPLKKWQEKRGIFVTSNPANTDMPAHIEVLTPEAFLARYDLPVDAETIQFIELLSEKADRTPRLGNVEILLVFLFCLIDALRQKNTPLFEKANLPKKDSSPNPQVGGSNLEPQLRYSSLSLPPLENPSGSVPDERGNLQLSKDLSKDAIAERHEQKTPLSIEIGQYHTASNPIPLNAPLPEKPLDLPQSGDAEKKGGLVAHANTSLLLTNRSIPIKSLPIQSKTVPQLDLNVSKIAQQKLIDNNSEQFSSTKTSPTAVINSQPAMDRWSGNVEIATNSQPAVGGQIEIGNVGAVVQPTLESTTSINLENDSSGKTVTQASSGYRSGVFTVGATGRVQVNYLFDGGAYQGELGLFSLNGLESVPFESVAFNQEVVRRVLSNSTLGYVAISDVTEGAQFSGELPWEGNLNAGVYLGSKRFVMEPGDQFGIVLLTNGTFQQLVDSTDKPRESPLLFSLIVEGLNEPSANSRIGDVTGQGRIFAMEDVSMMSNQSDRDFNDIVFQLEGVIANVPPLNALINPNLDWRTTAVGQTMLDNTLFANLPTSNQYGLGSDSGTLNFGSTSTLQNLLVTNPFEGNPLAPSSPFASSSSQFDFLNSTSKPPTMF